MTDLYLDVLIIGAGPACLMASLYLSNLGTNHRIIDKLGTQALNERVDGFHVRNVEIWVSFNMDHLLENLGNYFMDGYYGQVKNKSLANKRNVNLRRGFHQGFTEASVISSIRKRGGTVIREVRATSMSIYSANHLTVITVNHLHITEIDQWHVEAHFKHNDGTLEPQKNN